MIGVLRLFKNPAIELQPGQLAIDEALRTVGQVRDARRDWRGNLLACSFLRNNNSLCALGHGVLRAQSGFKITIAGGDDSASAIRYRVLKPMASWLAAVYDRHKFSGECPRHRTLLAQRFAIKQRDNRTRCGE